MSSANGSSEVEFEADICGSGSKLSGTTYHIFIYTHLHLHYLITISRNGFPWGEDSGFPCVIKNPSI